MRGHRLHQLCQRADGVFHRGGGGVGAAQGVGKAVKRGDGLVEGEGFDALRHVLHRPRGGAHQVIITLAAVIGRHLTNTRTQGPDAGEVLERRLCTRGRPFHIALRRAVGHDEPSGGISTVSGDDGIRVDHVLLGFRHLGGRDDIHRRAIAQLSVRHVFWQVIDWPPCCISGFVDLMRHHPLREQRAERLDGAGGQMPGLVHRAGEEAGIEEVQDRMLDPADVLIDVHPVGGVFGDGGGGGVRRGEAGVVPAAVHEGIHRIRLSPGRAAAFRAGGIAPGRVTVQGVARFVEGHVIGQADGQVCLRLRHHAAGVAVDHRDRAAPIALAAEAPVAQAVVGDTAPDAAGFAIGDGGQNRRVPGLDRFTRETTHIGDAFGFHRDIGFGQRCLRLAFGCKDRRDGQPVFGGKLEIPLVMGRAAEDRASAVIHQHEVGNVDRQVPVVVERVEHGDAGIQPQLLARLDRLG